jgi:hypothetical protein
MKKNITQVEPIADTGQKDFIEDSGEPDIEDLIEKGRVFATMCKAIENFALEKNMQPEYMVTEIFYSAVRYKKFLDKNLPI